MRTSNAEPCPFQALCSSSVGGHRATLLTLEPVVTRTRSAAPRTHRAKRWLSCLYLKPTVIWTRSPRQLHWAWVIGDHHTPSGNCHESSSAPAISAKGPSIAARSSRSRIKKASQLVEHRALAVSVLPCRIYAQLPLRVQLVLPPQRVGASRSPPDQAPLSAYHGRSARPG